MEAPAGLEPAIAALQAAAAWPRRLAGAPPENRTQQRLRTGEPRPPGRGAGACGWTRTTVAREAPALRTGAIAALPHTRGTSRSPAQGDGSGESSRRSATCHELVAGEGIEPSGAEVWARPGHQPLPALVGPRRIELRSAAREAAILASGRWTVVDLAGIAPATSRLQGGRSPVLSYRPKALTDEV